MLDVKNDKSKTYLDVSLSKRKKSLESFEVKELLASFPEKIKKFFIDGYLDSINEFDRNTLENYLLSHSEIAKLIKIFPGSAEAFEYLYLEKKSKYIFDNFFLKSKAGHQIYKRLISLDSNLLKILNQIYNSKTLIIDNIFSGPGRDLIRVVEQNLDLKNKINVRNIDIDKNAIAIGKSIIKEKGLDDTFSFVCSNYSEVQARQADLILLIGVLCPLNLFVSEKILNKIKKFSKPDNYIIYSTAQDSLLRDDPFVDYLMRLVGWNMHYKSDEEAWNLAIKAGWEPIKQFFDEPLHHHCMIFAKMK